MYAQAHVKCAIVSIARGHNATLTTPLAAFGVGGGEWTVTKTAFKPYKAKPSRLPK
jgi:hypothetical protein